MLDFWLPLTAELLIDGATARLKRPNSNFLDLIGRTRPGVNANFLEGAERGVRDSVIQQSRRGP